MKSLAELGFVKNCIFETIVSTYGPDGQPHAAPMGVSTVDGETLLIRPFKMSQTFSNIISKRCAVVNITTDPLLFYKSAYKEDLGFRPAVMVDAPALVDAAGWVEVEVGEVRELSVVRAEFLCLVRRTEMRDSWARPYSRAIHAVMESLIHSTRISIFLGTERHEEALRLVELVRWYRGVVERVAPGTAYAEIMAKLDDRISGWLRDRDG